MTVDVVVQPSGQSGLEDLAYVPLTGGAVVAGTSIPVTTATEMTVTEGVAELAACTIAVAAQGCSGNFVALTAGAHSVTYTFDDGVNTVSFAGTIFAVTAVAPTVTIEWQDADGTWIDGSGGGVPLLGSADTAARCVITNNSNAFISLASFTAAIGHPVGSHTLVPLTGTVDPGSARAFTTYAGPVSDVTNHHCTGGITFAFGDGSGGGIGGTRFLIEGNITASPLNVDPGDTVTVTATGLLPPVSSVYTVTVNGVAAPGSPTTLVMPGGDLSFDVVFPTSGTYTLAVHNVYSGQTITFASFTVNVTGLAATGADATVPLALGLLLLFVGTAFVVLRSRAA